jgi:DNA invertase Pin-like site-specific DNA recombinase
LESPFASLPSQGGFGKLYPNKKLYRAIPMTVYGYTRVSTTEQAADDRSGLDTQRRKILAAELSGLTVDRFIEEPGVSGGKPLGDRPDTAEFERDRIKERSAEGRVARRRDGGHIGRSAPFGFRKIGTGRAARLEPDPAQQAALADMRAPADQGLASRAIAAAVQERLGIAVSHVTVRACLARNVAV